MNLHVLLNNAIVCTLTRVNRPNTNPVSPASKNNLQGPHNPITGANGVIPGAVHDFYMESPESLIVYNEILADWAAVSQ